MAQRQVVYRLLVVNAVMLLAILATYPLFNLAGMWSGVTVAYVVITACLLAMCVLSMTIARAISPFLGLVFYVWVGWGAVSGMVWLDIAHGGRDFPALFYLLHGGIICLWRLGTRAQLATFAAATVIVIVAAALIYRQWDQAAACVLSAITVAMMGARNGNQ